MALREEECVITDDALDTIVDIFEGTSGIRDLEQAAEHIAANALYQIEVNHVKSVTFNSQMVCELLKLDAVQPTRIPAIVGTKHANPPV